MSDPHTLLRPKSLLVALVLWFFFGTFGIHRFYVGRGFAVPMLVLGLVAWLSAPAGLGLFLLLPVLAWWLVDLVRVRSWVREHNTAIGRG